MQDKYFGNLQLTGFSAFMAILNLDAHASIPHLGASGGEFDEHREAPEGDVLLAEPKAAVKRPPFFTVVMLNDDYTPMEFVIQLLKDVFRRPHEEAVTIMMAIHQKGAGVCGTFSRDVAETKADAAISLARSHEYPLQCLVERA